MEFFNVVSRCLVSRCIKQLNILHEMILHKFLPLNGDVLKWPKCVLDKACRFILCTRNHLSHIEFCQSIIPQNNLMGTAQPHRKGREGGTIFEN